MHNADFRWVQRPVGKKQILYDRENAKIFFNSSSIESALESADILTMDTFDSPAPLRVYICPIINLCQYNPIKNMWS